MRPDVQTAIVQKKVETMREGEEAGKENSQSARSRATARSF